VLRKWPELWPNDWIFYHDKAPDQKAPSVKLSVYGPKIDCCNETPILFPWFGSEWLLFPELKSTLTGQRFQDNEDIQNNVTTALKSMQKHDLHKCSQQWQTASLSLVLICSRGALRRWLLSVGSKCTGMTSIKQFRELHSQASYIVDNPARRSN